MCGIVGYIGPEPARDILLEGLKRLEYRGYDSAGVAVLQDGELQIRKAPGRISVLESRLNGEMAHGTIGIAHTRWATHGRPSERNAHPHCDETGCFALVHNGIIENYAALRRVLGNKGHQFTSETDTEVLAHLVAELYDGNLEDAVRAALREVEGTYGIAVLCEHEPNKMVVARKGSPLIIGVGQNQYVVASDAAAIVQHTNQVIYLSDGEVATLTADHFRTTTIDNAPVSKQIEALEMDIDQIELGTYEHFMLKEIFEQPASLANTLRGRLDTRGGQVILGGIADFAKDLVSARRVILTACGTAWHAGLLGEYLFEGLARMPVEVEYASELRYRNPIIEPGTVVVAISQSGETADTLAALEEVKLKGALTLGIVNVVGSTIARSTEAGVYLHAGPEIGVASTKAFTSQVAVLTMMSIFLGRRRHTPASDAAALLAALQKVPEQIERVLEQSRRIREVVEELIGQENWLFLGRGYNYPIALEGALKLKEISYIHAEGMPAAEMKHGPIALIRDGMPVVFIAPRGGQYEKVISNIEEVRSRGGRVIAVATEGDRQLERLADECFFVPPCPEPLQPLLTVVPLQLLAYHAAVLRGCNVDKPRNLAKSVTVE
jgi:glucosamine--fructose-6-phosphate aminotransferase (isomerizing)